MKKYWKIFWRMLRLNIMKSLSYKQDFWFSAITSLVFLFTQFFLVEMFFEASGIEEIAGYSKWDMYFVLTLLQVVLTIVLIFFRNNTRNMILVIHRGELDYFLLKPFNIAFLMSVQNFDYRFWINISFVIIFLPYVLKNGGYNFSYEDWLIILYLIIVSVVIYGLMYWVASLLSFFWSNYWGLWTLFSKMSGEMKYPKSVYPLWLSGFLTYVIPMFVVINPVYKVLDETFGIYDIFELNLILLMYTMFYLLLWRVGLRKYSSAN